MHRKSRMDSDQDKVPISFILRYGYYIVDYPQDYSDWQAEAKLNHGVIRIESESGEILWKKGAE